MATKLLVLLICIYNAVSLYSQTIKKATYVTDETYFRSRGAELVPTGSYTNALGKAISVQGFFMTNEITNKEYREFTDYVASHPDSALRYIDRKPDGSFFRQQISFSQIRANLIDSFAIASMYPSGSDLHNKYKNYFVDKKYEDYPVIGVSREAARYFCIWKTQQENERLKLAGKGMIADFRVPTKEEFEYAQSFSKSVAKKPKSELDKSKSGKPDKLGLYNLFGNAEEWTSNWDASEASPGKKGFRMVSTFLGG